MENASNALLISGGILIAMLIIAIAVVIFSNYGELGQTYDQTLQATEIQKFNTNFLKFEGKTDISIQEIVTLANFAKQYKEQTETDIKVIIQGEGNIVSKGDTTKLIKEYSNKKFKCGNITDQNYFTEGNEIGKIKSINFMVTNK